MSAVVALERDPAGLDAHAPGAKLDAGKPMVSLCLTGFSDGIVHLAKDWQVPARDLLGHKALVVEFMLAGEVTEGCAIATLAVLEGTLGQLPGPRRLCSELDVLATFPRALMAVADVATFGARKYTPNGWRQVSQGVTRYTDAHGRHVLWSFADTNDAQTGFDHWAHAAWNALAVLTLKHPLRIGS